MRLRVLLYWVVNGGCIFLRKGRLGFMAMNILFYWLLFFTITVQAQNFKPHLFSDFGLLQGMEVLDVVQDNTGFLWLGTNEGLYRYDGYDFKLYVPEDRLPGSTFVQTLYIDRQDVLWVGTRGGLLKYEKETDRVINFRHLQDQNSISGNIINSIVEDGDQNLWIALSKGGLERFDKESNTFHHFKQADKTGLLSDDISDLTIDKKNRLWITTWDFGVNRLDLNTSESGSPLKARFVSCSIRPSQKIVIDFVSIDPRTDKLYIGTNGSGLFLFDEQTETFEHLSIPLTGVQLINMTPVSQHHAWVSTMDGITSVNLNTLQLEELPNPLSEIIEPVNNVFIDNRNITWIGSKDGLIKYVPKKISLRRLADVDKFDERNNILAIQKQGKFLWLGSYGGGLFLKDEITGDTKRVNVKNKLLRFIRDIKLVDEKYLLIGVGEGMVRLDVRDFTFKDNFPERNFPTQSFFTSFSNNKERKTWIGTWRGGLYNFDPQTGELHKFSGFSTKNDFVEAICLDKENRLWIGTYHSGLIRLSNLNGKVEAAHFSEGAPPPFQISNDHITTIYEDNSGKIWVGTEGGGINVYDPETDKVNWMVTGDRNLPGNIVRAIVQDNNENIWVSFKNGISRYDPTNGFINYTKEDGADFLDFNFSAAEKSDSLLYFGNQWGYSEFKPSDLDLHETSPQVILTEFKVDNHLLTVGQKDIFGNLIREPIHLTKNIDIHYGSASVSFKFSSLDHTNPYRELYAYKLEGINSDWIYTNAFNRQVTYSNLAPGKYLFKVKAIRKNLTEGDRESVITIRVIPPFWKTTGFKMLAVVMLVVLAYVVHWARLVQLTKQKIKFEKLADERIKVIETKNLELQQQAAKLHESDKYKLIFFANISHEFRTPLMLIIGPLTSLLENKLFHPETERLNLIQRNAQRLLRLMDQIMDITKLDAGHLQPELDKGNLVRFVNDIAKSFDYLAHQKTINVEFETNEASYNCYFDHDKLEKILYNLLSNAVKVTPTMGLIKVRLDIVQDKQQLQTSAFTIEIFNTGKNIPKDDLPNLFTRFFRTKSYVDGTGIGLSLTKSLVELLGGSIGVTSEEDNGTTFLVSIPIRKSDRTNVMVETSREHVEKKNSVSDFAPTWPVANVTINPNAKTILVVEDDEDMGSFINHLLQPEYTVVRAFNGEEGIRFAYQFQPALIISDMIMPVMDGYQLLRSLKSDANVSHIPIILLTARASVEARLRGLEEGADDYITKPFNEKILLALVKNLIEQRRLIKERFSTDIELRPKEVTIATLDEKFLQSLLELVDANIADPELGPDFLCRELGIGRTYLYSKVKAITDQPVNEFIKTLRLKKAAVLLQQGLQNVNEVAVETGFNDRSHFSKSFTKHFGISPAQYQKDRSKL